MRKIKELEGRIEVVEKRLNCLVNNVDNKFDWYNDRIERMSELIGKLTTKVDEQEEFLQKVVCPFIAEKLANDLGDKLKGLGDALADLFTEEPKKKQG